MKKPAAVKIVEALGWAYVALAGASTRKQKGTVPIYGVVFAVKVRIMRSYLAAGRDCPL